MKFGGLLASCLCFRNQTASTLVVKGNHYPWNPYCWSVLGGASGKEHVCHCRRCWRPWFNPSIWKIPWRRAWQPTPVFSPGESQGQRSLAGYSPRGHKELTQLSMQTGEGNGTPLQHSCLEIPWTEEPGRLRSMGSLRVGHD